jgi:hypothetical protein
VSAVDWSWKEYSVPLIVEAGPCVYGLVHRQDGRVFLRRYQREIPQGLNFTDVLRRNIGLAADRVRSQLVKDVFM